MRFISISKQQQRMFAVVTDGNQAQDACTHVFNRVK